VLGGGSRRHDPMAALRAGIHSDIDLLLLSPQALRTIAYANDALSKYEVLHPPVTGKP